MNNIEHIKSQLKPILKKYGIKKAEIFGSSARGEFEVYDLNLLVKIDKKMSLQSGLVYESADDFDRVLDATADK